MSDHILTSIKMIALEMSVLSTHVVVKAANELVVSLAEHEGIKLDWDYRNFIKPEHQADFRKVINRPYNYFKHADRDAGQLYSGPDEEDLSHANDTMTMMNVNGYYLLAKDAPPYFNEFAILAMCKYPAYFSMKAIEGMSEFSSIAADMASDKGMFSRLLRAILEKHHLLPD